MHLIRQNHNRHNCQGSNRGTTRSRTPYKRSNDSLISLDRYLLYFTWACSLLSNVTNQVMLEGVFFTSLLLLRTYADEIDDEDLQDVYTLIAVTGLIVSPDDDDGGDDPEFADIFEAFLIVLVLDEQEIRP